MVCATGIAQNPDGAQVRKRLEQVANSYTGNNAYMGAVLVTNGDEVLLDKAFGMAVVEWSISNTTGTKFRLGSLTKQFTAALILLLQQDGKLNINDPVSKYLPDAPKAWEKITLANLLGHTSGIPNFTDFKEYGAWAASAHTWEEEYAFFRDRPLDFEPGAKYEYSNSNYEVLGGILEKVSGRKYGDLLRERLFAPLGMNESGLDNDELILPQRAEGYKQGPKGLIVARSESMSVPFSAGSIYSTTGDLLKWEHALFGGKVLSPDSLTAMTTAGKGGYGFGVMVNNWDGVKVVDHGGGIEGFNTSLFYVPEKRVCVVVLANVNGSAPDQMGKQLLDVALGKTVVLDSERKSVPITQAELAKFVGVYDLTPAFAITIAQTENGLTAQGTGKAALPMMYQGAEDGHPRFFVAQIGAEIEFVPDATGVIQSLILHQHGTNRPAKKQ
jgi:CubicO group peptidase (beta-lactamase class C family)